MKILGSDFDGTLNYGGMDEEKLSAVAEWRRAGNRFGIISGRGIEFRKTLREKFPDLKWDFLAVCNGGYIMDGEGEVVRETRCDGEILSELTSDLIGWGCKVVHVIGAQYICVVERAEDRPPRVDEAAVRLWETKPTAAYFYQVSVRRSTEEKTLAVVERIREKYGERLTPLQNGLSIDIVPRGVNKAEGLCRVAEFFGCGRKDVIAVGDNVNDMDMIRAFHSYAMANGVEEIREAAEGVVESVTELIRRELAR